MSVIAFDVYNPQQQKFALYVGEWKVNFSHREDFCFEVEAYEARKRYLEYSSVTDINFRVSRETPEKVKCYIWQALPALSTLSETPLIRVINAKTEAESKTTSEIEVEVDAKTDAEIAAGTEAAADPGTNSIVLEFLATNHGDGLRIPLYLPGCHP